jgi:phospholipase/lecithinase/hemolysin
MAFLRLRRAWFAAACAASLALAACGGGDVVSEFKPQRMVAFGDGFSDAGQRGGVRYTINDSNAINWTQQLASGYGLGIAATANGGTSYAIGSARITQRPDAQGLAATPTVTEQITAGITAGLSADDLVVVGAGTADLIVQGRLAIAGGQTQQAALDAARVAGTELGAQVRRLVNAGAKHVLLAGVYNLGRSPWAGATGQTVFLESLSTNFNDALKIAVVDLGANVLYVDTALYFNLVTANGLGYSFTDVNTVMCNSVDPGTGIGIGPGFVSSLLCNAGTLVNGAAATTLFADPVYFTPAGNQSFGIYAYERSKDRW